MKFPTKPHNIFHHTLSMSLTTLRKLIVLKNLLQITTEKPKSVLYLTKMKMQSNTLKSF